MIIQCEDRSTDPVCTKEATHKVEHSSYPGTFVLDELYFCCKHYKSYLKRNKK